MLRCVLSIITLYPSISALRAVMRTKSVIMSSRTSNHPESRSMNRKWSRPTRIHSGFFLMYSSAHVDFPEAGMPIQSTTRNVVGFIPQIYVENICRLIFLLTILLVYLSVTSNYGTSSSKDKHQGSG